VEDGRVGWGNSCEGLLFIIQMNRREFLVWGFLVFVFFGFFFLFFVFCFFLGKKFLKGEFLENVT